MLIVTTFVKTKIREITLVPISGHVDKENTICVHTHTKSHNGILLNHKKEGHTAISDSMDEFRGHYIRFVELAKQKRTNTV